MADANELVQALKKAALEAVDASKPVNVCFGKVETAKPLTINVEQKMILGEKQLILSRNVTRYTTMVTVQWETEKEETTHKHRVNSIYSEEQDKKHTHDIEGTKQMTFHNELEKGEEVILIRVQGGQKYVVLDRIGGGSA